MVFPALGTFQEEFGSTTAWTTWVLTGFLVSGAVADADPRPARRPVRQGADAADRLGLFLAGCLGAACAWNIWSLIAFRVVSGAGGGALPAQLRDHPRRVPGREGQGRDRPALGRLGDRRRLRDRPLGRDRRQLLVAPALPARRRSRSRSRSCSCTATCRSRRSARRRGSTCRARSCSPARCSSLMVALTEGEHWGWTLAAPGRRAAPRCAALRPLGARRSPLELADGRPAHARAPPRSC